jgi:UDP-N-acetyl-D-mannosaminuronic acid dehydrogenase
MKADIAIIGGAGHIGLPLGMLFAAKKKKVILYDKNEINLEKISNGIMPFLEKGGDKFLKQNKKSLFTTKNKKDLKYVKIFIVCIGTPVKNSKPDLKFFFNLFKEIKSYITPDKLLVIRSSIYPGTINKIQKYLGKEFKNISYCPERVVQGNSIIELPKLPQIVSGLNSKSIKLSKNLFQIICKKIIVTSILEAELIKLFSNAWRYINFSIANQFYDICENFNINFSQLRKNMIDGYERNKDIPKAGFAAGPCLFKDTAQLNSFLKNSFTLGIAATNINQNFPKKIYSRLKKKFGIKLKNKNIGILGVAFKSEIDDTRDSLAIELYKLLKSKKLKVSISDEYVKMKNIIDKKKLIKKSEILIIGAPHKSYKNIYISKNKYLIDTWGFLEK